MRIFMVLLLLISFPVMAQEQDMVSEKTYPTVEPGKEVLKKIGTGIVTGVIDGQRLQLGDSSIVHLTGIDIPDLYQQEPGEYALAAQQLLEELFQDQKINIYQTVNRKEGRTNRMGHTLAQITRADNNLWAQGALIAEGLARVRTTKQNRELATEMLELEDHARNNIPETTEDEPPAPYLWREEQYAVFNTDTVETATKENFQIVEGKILKVASRNNVIYLNFGQNWRNDFTISIPSEVRKNFSREGHSPLQWTKKTVRVRGWLDEYNGPHIEVDHPERIEFIEPEDHEEADRKFAVPPLDKEIIKDALPNIEQPDPGR